MENKIAKYLILTKLIVLIALVVIGVAYNVKSDLSDIIKKVTYLIYLRNIIPYVVSSILQYVLYDNKVIYAILIALDFLYGFYLMISYNYYSYIPFSFGFILILIFLFYKEHPVSINK